ncbi:MAG: fumarylacetoacetate hydrolase family protein [Pseudomonadota bacterium]
MTQNERLGTILPADHEAATLTGRVWRPDRGGPSVVTLKGADLFDVTSAAAPTMRDLLELDDPSAFLRQQTGERLCSLEEAMDGATAGDGFRLLAPADLQAIKACGVTFARSMIERVIEERAGGDFTAAAAIRDKIASAIGAEILSVAPGSDAAARAKSALQAEGLWSQYLEVGIGPDAEVFTKTQPMSAVGWGSEIGLHPISVWNNPEPEMALAVDSAGRIKGATLGNDVNLRDVEGRSALLLGKAKDNNASAALGPFVRLFDEKYTLDDVRSAEIGLRIEGEDGFELGGSSSMREISRDPLDLVSQTLGPHHQYPDGLFLYCGTMFSPTQDRDTPGQGFTHKLGDVVTISEARLGTLRNTVRLSTECPPWRFGAAALMRNLAGRNLI